MYVSLNKKQKIAIVVIIISMSIIAVLLSKLINHEEPKTVTKTPDITDSQEHQPKETSIPKPTKKKEITKSHEGKKSFSDFVNSYISSTSEKKEIELEVKEPIQEIKSESDIFETWRDYHYNIDKVFTKRLDEGDTTEWYIASYGVLHSKAIKRSGESFEIEVINDVLNDKGISISDCDIKFIGNYFDDIDYNSYKVFKIYDSNKEVRFLMNKDQLINLSDYGILFFNNGVYIVEENKTNFISLFNLKLNIMVNYKIPFKLKSIERAYILNQNDVYIVAKKNGEENVSYFKINVNDETIVESKTVKNLSESYPLKFSFKSDVILNKIVEEIGDVYVIEGSDDEVSSYKSDEFLYGVNKHTGQKVWSFFGDYLTPKYSISKDEKYITILNRIEGYAKCLEIQTGTVMWEEKLAKERAEYYEADTFNKFSKVFIVECNEKLVAVSKENWKSIWSIGVPESSNYRLIYKFSEDKRYVYYFDENDFKVKCIEINNGSIIWERKIDSSSHLEDSFNDCYLIKELFILFSEKRIIAFNKNDGSIAWKMELAKESGFKYETERYTTKVLINNNLFIIIYIDGLIAIDSMKGDILWDRSLKKTQYSYNTYKTLFNGKELLVLLYKDSLYTFDTKTGDIISEFHEEGLADYRFKVELKDNILYFYSRYSDADSKCINIETGAIEHSIEDSNGQIINELITGKDFYDGIKIIKSYSYDDDKLIAENKNGDIIWSLRIEGIAVDDIGYYHLPRRVRNKIYVIDESAIVCVDALTGKKLYKFEDVYCSNSQILKLSDGIYWAIVYNKSFDVYKID